MSTNYQGEFIQLDALLKTMGLASSGRAAKAMAADSHVQVDGQLELRKRCKIWVGQVITVGALTSSYLAFAKTVKANPDVIAAIKIARIVGDVPMPEKKF